MGDASCPLPCSCPCPCPSSLEDLMLKLRSHDPLAQRDAALALRSLAKTSSVNRFCIGEIGAIPPLVSLLSSPDPLTQTHSITALFNLTLRNDTNKAAIAASAKSVDAVVQVLLHGPLLEAKENAAALLCNLSRSKACADMKCGQEMLEGLVGVLTEGSGRGKRDAAAAMYNLLIDRQRRRWAVSAGAVEALLQIALDKQTGLTDESLAVLTNLARDANGSSRMESAQGMEGLLALVRDGSDSNKEFASALLLSLCQQSRSAVRALDSMAAQELLLGLSNSGTERARRKAMNILELL